MSVKSKNKKPEGEKKAYEKWTTIATPVVAASALIFNIVLGINNINLTKAQNELAQKNAQIEERLKSANLENLKLNNEILNQGESERKYKEQVQRYQNSIDIHQRFLVFSGFDLVRFDSSPPAGTFKNKVFYELEKWLPTRSDGINYKLYESPDPGTSFTNGLVLFHVRNRGKVIARNIVLTLHQKNFNLKGEDNVEMWNLGFKEWPTRKFKMGDLDPGQEKYVPLLRTTGVKNFIGLAYMPAFIEWDNPITQVHEKVPASRMLPIDEWQAQGLVFVSQ